MVKGHRALNIVLTRQKHGFLPNVSATSLEIKEVFFSVCKGRAVGHILKFPNRSKNFPILKICAKIDKFGGMFRGSN